MDMISSQEMADLATARSRVYGFLGALYNRIPDESFAAGLASPEMAAFLTSLRESDDEPGEMREGLQMVQAFIQASKDKPAVELRTELAVERTRLFRGIKPGYSPPPPYESVYVGGDQQPVVQASMSVLQVYAESGVGLPEEVRDQPDYIGFELDFMRHLTEKEAQAWATDGGAEAAKYVEKERTFLNDHITPWVPRFCDVMVELGRLDFYRGVARVTKGFVLQDAANLAGLTSAHPIDNGGGKGQ